MRRLYPRIEPFNVGTLKVSGLHTLSYEEVGNPEGRPALFLHGGPGIGIHTSYRQFFDPSAYRIILIDQRGAGKSTPHGETLENTTSDIVSDLEAMRLHLRIADWVVMGGSWGSLLGLCYAICHPTSVAGLIIRGVFLGRPAELEWLYGPAGAAMIYPDEWDRFLAPIEPGKNLLNRYVELINSTDEGEVTKAVQAWSRWGACMNTLFPDEETLGQLTGDHTAVSIARLKTHYTANNFFLPSDNYVLDSVTAIEDIPCWIVQGRYDIICPPVAAWELHKKLRNSRLSIVPNGAHSPSDEGMVDGLVSASDDFRSL